MSKAAKKKAAEETPAPAPKRGKKDELPPRADVAALLMQAINKDMKGSAELSIASTLTLPYLTKRLPTGILTLDLELRGGFPGGGVSEIIVPPSAGKSYLYWQIIRQLQYILGDKLSVLLAMTEFRADRTQGRTAGAAVALADEDIAAMERGRIENGLPGFTPEERVSFKHEIGHIYEAHGMDAESLYTVILEGVKVGAYHLIVIDSFGSIMSGAEREKEMNEYTFGGASGVNTKFLHKLSSMLCMKDSYGRTRDVCVLGINQIRDNLKDPNKPFKASGGNALGHAKFADLFVTSGARLKEKRDVYTVQGNQKLDVEVGKEVNWRIEKGKAGMREGARGSFVFSFDIAGADVYLDALVAAMRYELVERNGNWFSLLDPQDPKKVLISGNGADQFKTQLYEDMLRKKGTEETTFLDMIRMECFRRAGINISYEGWE